MTVKYKIRDDEFMNVERQVMNRLNGFKWTIFVAFISFFTTDAQEVIKLWEGAPPTSNEITDAEVVKEGRTSIGKVSIPTLEIYLPEKEKATGMAVVICPGGGYSGLAYDHEGLMVAKWLNGEGIAAFILKYRMPNKHKEVPLDDAQQAIRYVREHAEEYGINASKIGICGFSAGGHLASTASTHFATIGTSTRPDFSILFYPVVTMTKLTHGGSRSNLLGENPSEADIFTFSNEKQVNVNTPPAILLLSDDDNVVLPENSVWYYEALKRNKVPATMYIFPSGGHGWGFRDTYAYYRQMTGLLSAWLKSL
ncbi:MAG: alpha/beta hydrolase [Tannerella sp.]|jgi:acetyl esterase/lipase|nr:alpha/beta hydrolase [Tannerella sp.]